MARIDDQNDEPCPRCGARVERSRCSGCGHQEPSSLRLLPALRTPEREADEQRSVRLLREYKGPTVKDLLGAAETVTERLPGRARAAKRAIDEGDLARADRLLGEALGALLPGPGAEARARTRAWVWPFLLWLWCTILVCMLSLGLLTSLL